MIEREFMNHDFKKYVLLLIILFSFDLYAMVDPIAAINRALMCARYAERGEYEQVKIWLENGVAVNCCDEWGETLLYNACYNSHLKIVQLLLENGADTELTNRHKRTPLHHACYRGHLSIMELLLKAGADIDCADSEGLTPLHEASFSKQKFVVKLLLKYNADINCKNNKGETPLDVAKSAEIIELITAKIMERACYIQAIAKHPQSAQIEFLLLMQRT